MLDEALLAKDPTLSSTAATIIRSAEQGDPDAERLVAQALSERNMMKLAGKAQISPIKPDDLAAAQEELKERGKKIPRRGERSATAALAAGRTRTVRGKLNPEWWTLCPLCGLVVYDGLWHGVCWRTWWPHGADVKSWSRDRMKLRGKGLKVGKELLPFPYPQALPGDKPSSEELHRGYVHLMARQAGESFRAIARREGVAHTTVMGRIESFVNRLPGDWNLVYSGNHKLTESRARSRQSLVPLPSTLPRKELSRRTNILLPKLLDAGMPREEASELLGLEQPPQF